MSDFIESPREREQFDRETQSLFGGNPLEHVAATLTVWQKVAPQQGSYAALLAVIANEVAKASTQLPAARTEIDRLLTLTSEQATEILGKDKEIERLTKERDEAIERVKAMRLYMERDDEVPL